MSYNPFLVTKVDTLKEAFPNIDHTVLENALWSENGDMAKTFERLLAISDPSATSAPDTTTASSGPAPPPRTATTANHPRIRPPTQSSQQRPLLTPPAKPAFQSVREELAQWRQELSNDRDLRRTSRRSHRRNEPHCGLRSSAASNYELQSSYREVYSSLGDVVNEGKTTAIKAATSLYDRIVAAHSVYGNPSLSSSASSSSPPSSSSSVAASYAYHQSNNTTPNLYSRSSVSSATILSPSRSYNNNGNNLPSSSTTSRNRPLPHTPQSTQQNHARNPFDSSDHAETMPPPTYEARENDALIDPVEGDRLLLHTPSHTS
ncbi:hypothetical protein BCR42DRAFT_402730 [Absidia repens]|uniref:CUE domain-containing protein n=1 Tax=Absidia repens TaxID=90262 RepID=A0A1X2IYK5_9FUNG|nr:hypothetical protein BCR42DRAFT_402730 [Absidia repens]